MISMIAQAVNTRAIKRSTRVTRPLSVVRPHRRRDQVLSAHSEILVCAEVILSERASTLPAMTEAPDLASV